MHQRHILAIHIEESLGTFHECMRMASENNIDITCFRDQLILVILHTQKTAYGYVLQRKTMASTYSWKYGMKASASPPKNKPKYSPDSTAPLKPTEPNRMASGCP